MSVLHSMQHEGCFITQHNKLYESPELAKFVLSRSTCFFLIQHIDDVSAVRLL